MTSLRASTLAGQEHRAFFRYRDKRTTAMRHKLCEHEKNSLLYKALLELEQKNCIHTDLKWHHIGLYSSYRAVSSRNCSLLRGTNSYEQTNDEVVFCDLAGILTDHSENGWADREFQRMKSRIESELTEGSYFP